LRREYATPVTKRARSSARARWLPAAMRRRTNKPTAKNQQATDTSTTLFLQLTTLQIRRLTPLGLLYRAV
jgi:hypothetical protein